jgi:hypothetical protein
VPDVEAETIAESVVCQLSDALGERRIQRRQAEWLQKHPIANPDPSPPMARITRMHSEPPPGQ